MTLKDFFHAAAPAFFYILLSNILYSVLSMFATASGIAVPKLAIQAAVLLICLALFWKLAAQEGLFEWNWSGRLQNQGRLLKVGRGAAFRYPACFCYVVSAIMCSVCCNEAFLLSNFIERSPGYRHVSGLFYGNDMLLEVFTLCVLSPVVEEIVYRGFVYGRLQKKLDANRNGGVDGSANGVAAAALAALLFGVAHFNLVQGIYAFLLGFLLGIFVWKMGGLYLAMAAHMAINLVSVIWTETDWLDFIDQGGAGRMEAIGLSALLAFVFFGYGNRLAKRMKAQVG